MFFRTNHLQYRSKPDAPDPVFARQLQEALGGQWGEMSVMITYLFQGWNCRGPAKYKDMIMDIGTEEIGHVEMLATMIARLLETAPVADQEHGASNPLVATAMGGGRMEDVLLGGMPPGMPPGMPLGIPPGMNPQHYIVAGLGATPADSNGYPFVSRYTIASGNLLADFRFNVAAESQGRLQVSRLYNLTQDKGVRDMLAFSLARDTMHQNQWLAAIEELKADGLEDTPVPSSFPEELQRGENAYQFWNLSGGTESSQGRWASGTSPDGKGTFEYLAEPKPLTDDMGVLGPVDPRVYGTPMQPVPQAAAE